VRGAFALSARVRQVKIDTALVPVDLSEYSLRVLKYAPLLKQIGVFKVYLLHVIEAAAGITFATLATLKEEVRSALEETGRELRRQGLEVEILDVRQGHPAEEIAREARERASIIAMMSRGRGFFRMKLLGSVAEEVLNMCARPTLVFREERKQARRQLNTVMAALALDSIDEMTLSYALALARSTGCRLLLTHVLRGGESGMAITRRLEGLAEELKAEGVSVDVITSVGRICKEILEIAEHTNADMIVLGDNECAERPEARLRGRSVIDCVVRRFPHHSFVVF